MISAFAVKSAAGAARYYDKAFTTDGAHSAADNYYLSEQAAATWQGRGAALLNMEGTPVRREDFVSFLDGVLPDPNTGELQNLSANSRGEDRRSGYDFTISPPKSVSVVALVGRDERVLQAHRHANEVAMDWLEQHGAVVRVRNRNGETVHRQAGNLLYATVLHETNRENEPQLHNHNVIVSAVYDEDSGKWRSLTNDQLFKLRAQADVIYKSELSHALRAAGYQLDHAANGVDFEVAGISGAQLDEFSTRRGQIKEALVRRGIDPASASYEARQTAALDSRSDKSDVPREALHDAWRETARNAGLNLDALVEEARSRGPVRLEPDPAGSMRAVSWAVAHLSEREQAFTLPELEIQAVQFGGRRLGEIQEAVERHVASHAIVESAPTHDGARVMTTPGAVEQEIQFAQRIQQGKGKGLAVLDLEADFTESVKRFETRKSQEAGKPFKLSDEQVVAARNLLMHRDAYQGVQGDAGTGKTAALELVREAAEAKGWAVVGVATSAAAAKELERSSGIPSTTVAAYLVDRENAMRLTVMRMVELRTAVESQARMRIAAADQTETKVMRLSLDGVDVGAKRYLFDHDRGEVFHSPRTLSNSLGQFLLDVAARGREAAGTGSDGLKSRTLLMGASAAESLGRSFTTYERVGRVEAVAAQTALYLEKTPDSELKKQYERTKAALDNLTATGNVEGKRTLLVMDETSMTGVADALKVSDLAHAIGARVVLQGDVKQHESVPAGRAFRQAQEAGIKLSVLSETRRFDNATEQTKLAIDRMKEGDFGAAYSSLDIREVPQRDLAAKVAERYLANIKELAERGESAPSIGIVVVTNADRKAFNAAVHGLLATNGLVSQDSVSKEHFDDPKLTVAQQVNVAMLRRAEVDHLVFRKNYAEIGVKKGDVVVVDRYDIAQNLIHARNPSGRPIVVNPRKQDLFSPARLEVRQFSVRDQVEARANIKLPVKGAGRVTNGTRGVIQDLDSTGGTVRWADGRTTRLSNDDMRVIDHAYAHTTFREQGATTHREIIAISESGAKAMNSLAAYVAATRAKDNTEIVTSDKPTLLKNVSREVQKTTALDRQTIKAAGRGDQIDFDRVAGPLLTRSISAARDQGTQERELPRDKGQELER